MCIVLDVNSFHCLFDTSSQPHKDFRPVLDWVVKGRGKFVFGGSTYNKELREMGKYLKVIIEFQRAGKIVKVNDSKVDIVEDSLSSNPELKACDDVHLIAIIAVSGCHLICTNDKKLIPFLKNRKSYPKGIKTPRVFQNRRNCNLLSDKYISDCCLPSKKLNKSCTELLMECIP